MELKPTRYLAKTFGDERGWLKKLEPSGDSGLKLDPLKFDDFYLSLSRRHVFRGFHMQAFPCQQTKLIRVVSGSIVSYMLNLDPASPSYQALSQFTLAADENAALVCPPLHGNGFLALDDDTTIAVLTAGSFVPSSEVVISPRHVPGLQLPADCILSTKDENGLRLSDYLQSSIAPSSEA